ncbi:hypothetical protein LXL04_027811 [Taraxacum kok-saghyz]
MWKNLFLRDNLAFLDYFWLHSLFRLGRWSWFQQNFVDILAVPWRWMQFWRVLTYLLTGQQMCYGFKRWLIRLFFQIYGQTGQKCKNGWWLESVGDNDLVDVCGYIGANMRRCLKGAQGQTIPIVDVYYRNRCSLKLYVALSRGISCENTKVLVKPVKEFINEGVYTSNVEYREVLHDI